MIASEHQRKGYGRAALLEILKYAREEGRYDMVYLDYVPENTSARALYASLGFRENGKRKAGRS